MHENGRKNERKNMRLILRLIAGIVYIMLTFLEMNGIRIQCTDEELVHIGLSVADGSMKYEDLLQWVRDHE